MKSRISITELARNLADCVNRVAYRGERFTVIRGSRAVAELVPVPMARRLEDLPAMIESLPRLGSEEAACFEADLEMARQEMNAQDLEDPWAS